MNEHFELFCDGLTGRTMILFLKKNQVFPIGVGPPCTDVLREALSENIIQMDTRTWNIKHDEFLVQLFIRDEFLYIRLFEFNSNTTPIGQGFFDDDDDSTKYKMKFITWTKETTEYLQPVPDFIFK